MARPRKYPKAIDQAIWAAMIAGHGPRAIQEMLVANQLGLGRSIAMPYRTIQAHSATLRKERGDPRAAVDSTEKADEIEDGMRRSYLSMLRSTQLKLEKKSRGKDGLNASDVKLLRETHAAMTEISRALKPDPQRQGRTRSKAPTEKDGFLATLKRDHERSMEARRQGETTPANGSENPLRQADTAEANGNGEATKDDEHSDGATRSAESARDFDASSVPAAA